MLPKFIKQYSILKLMLGNFNICHLILIKIFISVTCINFALCSFLHYVKQSVYVTSTVIHSQRKDATFSRKQENIGSLSSVFFCHSTTQIKRVFSQNQNLHWITIQAFSSFENITSFLCLWVSVDITYAIFCNISQNWTESKI